MTWAFRDGRSAVGGTSQIFAARSLLSTIPSWHRGRVMRMEFEFENEQNYDIARDHLEFAGNAAYGTDLRSLPWYVERNPSFSAVGTLVRLIEPQNVNTILDPVWVLIVGGRETSPPPLTRLSMRLDCFMLAPGADYDTKDDIDADLGHAIAP